MLIQTRHTHHKALFKLLQHVCTCREGHIRVAELAELAGFSRAHFTRTFGASLGETPAEFERRLRLERACHMLIEERTTIIDASAQAEYANPEAFTRAFRSAYGATPSLYRRQRGVDWRLNAPSGVHWLPEGHLTQYRPIEDLALEVQIIERPAQRLAVIRHTGNYLHAQGTWRELERLAPSRPWNQPGVSLCTVYHDDPVRVEDHDTLRSDVGFVLSDGEPAPAGMRSVIIPAGVYVVTTEPVDHQHYMDAWGQMNREWLPRRGSRPANIPAIDQFESWPLPWQQRRMRLMIGVDIELGYI